MIVNNFDDVIQVITIKVLKLLMKNMAAYLQAKNVEKNVVSAYYIEPKGASVAATIIHR